MLCHITDKVICMKCPHCRCRNFAVSLSFLSEAKANSGGVYCGQPWSRMLKVALLTCFADVLHLHSRSWQISATFMDCKKLTVVYEGAPLICKR